jgi:hypothetical protein
MCYNSGIAAVVTNVIIFWEVAPSSPFIYELHGAISQKVAIFIQKYVHPVLAGEVTR